MDRTDALLLAAVQAAPRRYRMPPLPATAQAAAAAGTETALAFAIEAARAAHARGVPAAPELGALFTQALADFLRAALAPEGGDASFQALVLQAHEPELQEYVRLAAAERADQRALRTLADAVAHPGKTRGLSAGPLRDALAQLHAAATAGAWSDVALPASEALAHGGDTAPLQALLASPALQRLQRLALLRQLPLVRRYLALCALRGPQAGSAAASAQGRAAARLGDVAERATVEAFRAIAQLLDAQPGRALHRVVRSLRTPPGFPGAAGKAKDEWDVAILRAGGAADAADLLLLAEVKASPAAATPDFARLHRGLQRLAHADAGAVHAFPSADGTVLISGASLRGLHPQAYALPPRVVYCCTAAAEAQPPPLSAASKAVLAAEATSLAFARALVQGGAPAPAALAPVWEALPHAPRLRSTLHQYETACAVRAAMLHPQDLRDTVARLADGA